MHKRYGFIALILVTLAAFTFSEEVILQNGSDYSGCEDTYLSDQDGQNENYGEETMCSLQGYH